MKPDRQPFFSVVVPCFNHEEYIGAALNSLRQQTDSDWEAVVVDDGSTDSSGSIIDEFARRDTRIRPIHKPNGGEASALNAGIEASRGQWICWLSSDDLFKPEKLAVHRDWIGRHSERRYFYTDFDSLDDLTGELRPGYVTHTPGEGRELLDLFRVNYINGISICVHRDVFESCGGFDEGTGHGQDYDFHLRAVSRFRPMRIAEVTCTQRVHAGQLSSINNHKMFCDCASAAIRFLNKTPPCDIFGDANRLGQVAASALIRDTMEIAVNCDSITNCLGFSPCLLLRLVEWISTPGWSASLRRKLRRVLGRSARSVLHRSTRLPASALLLGLSLLCEKGFLRFRYRPVSVQDVTEAGCYWRSVRQTAKLPVALPDCAEVHENRTSPLPAVERSDHPSSVVVIASCRPEAEQDLAPLADRFVRCGWKVLVLRSGQKQDLYWVRGATNVSVSLSLTGVTLGLAATPSEPIVLTVGEPPHFANAWQRIWRAVPAEKVDPDNWRVSGITSKPGEARSACRAAVCVLGRIRRVLA